MKQDLHGKVLVLTGAGGGIGRAIALRMAQCGMKLRFKFEWIKRGRLVNYNMDAYIIKFGERID